jgi:putative membrane protein
MSAPTMPGKADPDSRARTHLANERTFLAWLRTGLSLMALGFAASQFIPNPTPGRIDLSAVLAVVLTVSGLGLTGFGGWRFRKARDEIDAGRYLPSTGMVVVSVALMMLIGALVMVFVAVFH